ncbi:AEC family transporter [Methanobrevibacter sp. DSM 116169]|uniref:AEC family transporter n=1 Tax=Methanobrevibacter sp. DSM 116169 TaxID=3242727 RepID=UPI0038FC93E4
MDPIISTILSIIIMVFLGFILKKINLVQEKDVDSLNKIVINLFMPCMIFNALFAADLSSISNFAFLPVVMILSATITGIIAFFILKFFNFSKEKVWSVLVTILLSNTAFLGFPVALGIFGNDGLIRAIFCDMGTLIIFLSVSFILFLVFGGTIKEAIKKILLFPPLWAVILGISFNLLNIPIGEIPSTIITYLAGGAIPLIMISLGLSLKFDGLKWNKNMIAFTSIFKLLIFPLIAFCIINIFNFSGLEYKIALIEAAMPSGMLTMVLAITYGLDIRLTSDCVLSNTIFSLISLPIIISIL